MNSIGKAMLYVRNAAYRGHQQINLVCYTLSWQFCATLIHDWGVYMSSMNVAIPKSTCSCSWKAEREKNNCIFLYTREPENIVQTPSWEWEHGAYNIRYATYQTHTVSVSHTQSHSYCYRCAVCMRRCDNITWKCLWGIDWHSQSNPLLIYKLCLGRKTFRR